MGIIEQLITLLEQLAEHVPVEPFAFFGSLIEELIAPIPSPVVMTLSGSMVASNDSAFWYLFVIAVIAAVGKTIGAIILYTVADKAEDVVLSRAGRYIGITHKQVEQIGSRFKGTPRDYVTLLVIRATPIIPSAPISLICGLLAIPRKLFIISTFFGTIVRDFVYLYIGFTGLSAAAEITHGIEGASSIVTVLLGLIGLGIFIYIFYRKRKVSHQADTGE
jgi:membrane protein DedA with SNARE-associated domain